MPPRPAPYKRYSPNRTLRTTKRVCMAVQSAAGEAVEDGGAAMAPPHHPCPEMAVTGGVEEVEEEVEVVVYVVMHWRRGDRG